MVEYDAVNQLRVFYRAANLLDNADISEVDIRGGLRGETGHCRDSDGRKGGGVLGDNLKEGGRSNGMPCKPIQRPTHFRVQGSGSGTEKRGLVVEVDGGRQFCQVLNSLRRSLLERLRDDSGMHALLQHLLCCAEQTACENNDGGGAVTSLNVLCGGKIDKLIACKDVQRIRSYATYHLGSRVQCLYAFQDRCTIVCDDELSFGRLDLRIGERSVNFVEVNRHRCTHHLVHTPRTQRCPHSITNRY